MFYSNLSAQDGFVLTWDSQVACLEYDDVDKRIPLENIEEGNCLKVCEGSVVRYSLFYNEEQIVEQVNWNVQGGEILSSNQNSLQVLWPVAGEDAEVSVEILLADGEVIQATLCVEIKPKPNAFFEIAGIDNAFYCEDTDLYFNNLSTTTDGSNIVSSIWNFGNGDFSNAENPVYSYNEAGEYEVTLTVRDECNCTSEYTQTISVLPPAYQIECPTVTCENAIETYFIEVNPEAEADKVDCNRFNWSVDGGEIIEQDSNWVSVLWNNVDSSGFGTIYFDQSDCNVECNSVLAARIPVVQEQGTIQGGQTELCEGEQSVFSLPQWPTTDFQWTLVDNFGTAYPNNTFLTDQRNEIAVGTEGLISGIYTLKANYTNTLNSCGGTAEIDIKVLENLEIDQHPAVSCIENVVNFQLVNTNATNAQWTIKHINNTVATGTGNSFDYDFTQTGLHTITVNADGFCDNPFSSSSIEIVDNPSFPSNTEILGEDSICPNQLLSYSLSNVINEGNIIWSVSNGQIIGPHQGDEVSVIFDEGFTNYQVSAQLSDPNAENCLSSVITKDINLFQVDEQIVDNATPPSTGSESYCASSLAEFSLNYQDSDTYVWTFDPPQLATVSAGIGTNNPIILFNEPFTDSSGNYINAGQIIVSAKVCGQMQEIDKFDFSLIESPSLMVNMPEEVCAGTPFDVDITSSIELPGLSPQDVNISFENNFNNFNNTTINSTTSYTIHDIVLNNVDSDLAIGYNISIENDICNDATASGTITVKPAPEADISLFSGSNTFCQAENIDAVLQVNVQDPNGNQSFQWLFNAVEIQGETSNTIDLSNNNNGFGTYTVQVTGTNGCVTTTSDYEIFMNCEDKLECEDETISVDANWINCNQVEVTATFSNNPVSVVIETSDSFSNANATFDSAQSSPGQVTYIFNVNTSGSFKFKAQANYNDCFSDSLASVDVGYHPILNTEITCNSNGNGYDVILHNDSTFLPSFNNLEANYDITNTDTGQSIVIDPSVQDFNQATATLPSGNYQFTLSIQESGFPLCEVTEQVDLSLPDATFSISNSSPFCTEEQVVLSPTSPDPNVTYQWEFQGATNTLQDIVIQMGDGPDETIKLTATNAYGCSSTFSIENLEVLKAEFSGQIIPQNPLICEGETINLSYHPEFGETPPTTYQWLLNNQLINGATNATYTASTEGLYSLKLTDTNGCLYEELAGVYVNKAPNPRLNIDVNTQLCEGEDLIFSGSVSPDNASYQISVLQNGQPNIVQSWTAGPNISYTETMQTAGVFEYLIEAKDNTTNCETSETITVTVLPSIEPQIDIQLNQCEAYSVILTITNPQPNAIYTWSNGMQGTSITVDTGGAYSVTYQPQSGCSTTANVFVPKSPDEFLWIFPDGCIDFCTITVRSEPVPYIIGPIPEFDTYLWDFNNSGNPQNGVVSDYVIVPSDGILNLSLTNDLGCISTSADLDIDIDEGCDASCNIEYNLESIANSNNNFISYDIIGSINNNNNFAVTLSLTSYNGVYTPNTITIPANSSVSFNSTNLLSFIPDAGFTGGSDFVQVMGQQAGDAFCIHEIEIIYNNSQPRIDAKLKASPNPVKQRTEVFYEFLNIDKVENAEIEIYTILGYHKDRRKITNVKGDVLLDISTYSSGQYIVVLKHGGKILNQLLLIKE